MKRLSSFIAVCITFCLFALLPAAHAAAPLKEKSLPLIVPSENYAIFMESAQTSLDSRHVAAVARKGKKFLIVQDGRTHKEYDQISKDSPIFSPDSKRLVYKALKGTRWTVVVDGVEGKSYENMSTPSTTTVHLVPLSAL